MVRSGHMRKETGSSGHPLVAGWFRPPGRGEWAAGDRRSLPPRTRPRRGGFGLYLAALLVLLLVVSALFFFPQYMNMRTGIYRISCKEIRRKIEVAISNFDSNNTRSFIQPGKTIPLDFLKAEAFLSEIQRCPEGGKFLFGPAGETLCTIHKPTPKDESEAGPASHGTEPKQDPGSGK